MLLTISMVLAALLACPRVQEPRNVEWETDLGAAVERARETGRPLLIVFR